MIKLSTLCLDAARFGIGPHIVGHLPESDMKQIERAVEKHPSKERRCDSGPLMVKNCTKSVYTILDNLGYLTQIERHLGSMWYSTRSRTSCTINNSNNTHKNQVWHKDFVCTTSGDRVYISSENATTVFIYLTDVTVDNATEFFVGHRHSIEPETEAQQEGATIRIPGKRGTVVAFNCNTWHRGIQNRKNVNRDILCCWFDAGVSEDKQPKPSGNAVN